MDSYVEVDAVEAATLEGSIVASDRQTYKITVTYGADANIPEGATLRVREIEGSSDEYARYAAKADAAVGEDQKVTFARFFDITILDGEGGEVQPSAPVEVEVDLADSLPEDVRALHFGKKVELIDAEANGGAVAFEASGFSVYGIVGTKELRTEFLSHDGQRYEVVVTYDQDAEIPEGSKLDVSEFVEGTAEYNDAKRAVIADKVARGETDDVDTFNMAALDISIVDPDGNEFEPKAAVKVDLRIKELPGVEDLDAVAGTLAVQHHVETEDGVVVETVSDGTENASFVMDTDESVAAAGEAVQPGSVDLSRYGVSTFELRDDGTIVPAGDDHDLDVSFETEAFSTFTITWGSSSSATYKVNGTIVRRIDELANGQTYIVAADIIYNNNHYYYALTQNNNNGDSYRIAELDGTTYNRGTNVSLSGITNNMLWKYNHTSADNDSKVGSLQSISDSTRYLNLGQNTINTTNRQLTFTSGYWDNYNHLRVRRDSYYLRLNTNSNPSFERSTNSGDGNNDRTHLVFISVDSQEQEIGNTPHATIHYVDESGQELTVSKGSISSTTLLNSHAYLIYDIEGGEYEYKEAYIRHNSTNTTIDAYLNWTGSNWQYRSSGNWNNVQDGDDIYVVYKKKATPSQGGTPTLVQLTEDNKPESPTVTKKSKDNGNGTNTISLAVTSHTKPREVLKLADVVVIFDVSGSMNYKIDKDENATTDSTKRLTILKNAVNSLANSLIGENTEYVYTDPQTQQKTKQIRMSLVTFSNTATDATDFTDSASTFSGWVSDLSADGGTNWEYALQKANEASVDDGRATFVIFVTDGDPTFRVTRMTDTDSSLSDDFYTDAFYRNYKVYGAGSSDNIKDGTDYGRNYRAALVQAQSIVGQNKNLYMIGIGPNVSNLNQLKIDSGAEGYYPATSSSALTEAFEEIKKKIAATAGYADFQIDDGITKLTNTVEKSHLTNVDADSFTYYKNGVLWTAEQRAAEGCQDAKYEGNAVKWDMGESFFPSDGVEYRVDFVVWPKQEAYDTLANINNAADPDEYYDSLDEDVRNQISKEGGKYVLKTNEDDAGYSYHAATQSGNIVTTEGAPITGTFPRVDPLKLDVSDMPVKKNFAHDINNADPFQKIRFYLKVGDKYYQKDGTTSDVKDAITSYTIDLPKVPEDGQTMTEEQKWSDDVYIAAGLLKELPNTEAPEAPEGTTIVSYGGKYYQLLETGHEYSLDEEILEGSEFEYEFTPQTVRPMVFGTQLKYLVHVDDYNPLPSGTSPIRIDGKDYFVASGQNGLIGTNRKTAELDITKKVDTNGILTPTQEAEETFTYRVTLRIPDGTDPAGIVGYEYVYRPTQGNAFYLYGYHVYENNTPAATAFADDIERLGNNKYRAWNTLVYQDLVEYDIVGGKIVSRRDANGNIIWKVPAEGGYHTVTYDMTLKQNEVIRFTNLPTGTKYTIQEKYANKYPADNVGGDTAGRPPVTDASNVASEGYSIDVRSTAGTTVDTEVEDDTVYGTIEELDTRYYNQFTNRMSDVLLVNIAGRKHLDGYTWSGESYHFTLAGNGASPMPGTTALDLTAESGNANQEDIFGQIRLTAPGAYTYTVTEENAGTIQNVNGKAVQFGEAVTFTINVGRNTETNKLYVESVTGDGAEWDEATKTATATITNKQLSFDVSLLKYGDSEENPLEGVEFKLYNDLDREQQVTVDALGNGIGEETTEGSGVYDGVIKTNASGGFGPLDLFAGTYYLFETKGADGYNMLADPVIITIGSDGHVTATQGDDTKSLVEEYPANSGKYVIKINNPSGAELPHSGGVGTQLILAIGAGMIAAGALVLFNRKRGLIAL